MQGGVVMRTRPLCAYPMVAKYRFPAAGGSIDDSNDFTCARPTGESEAVLE